MTTKNERGLHIDPETGATVYTPKERTMTTSDFIIIAQEMSAAFRKYAESADNLTAMEEFPGQFANAISGQRQMAHECSLIARKAREAAGLPAPVFE
jgi:hypothetical protein